MLGFNRWHPFEVLAVILCIAGISWLALGYFIPAPPSRIAIAGSFKGSHYNFVTAQYKEILARSHVMVDPRLTETAAAANIGGLEFLFGIPGFGSVMAILWLMIAKPF